MERRQVSSGTQWESAVGYSRAVRTGPFVHVSGTTATDEDGTVVGEGEPAVQTKYALTIVEGALEELGVGLSDVVRTRLYVTDIDQWNAIGDAHAEVFDAVRPATTMVEVSRLVDPAHLVEVEATALSSDW